MELFSQSHRKKDIEFVGKYLERAVFTLLLHFVNNTSPPK